LGLMIEKKLDVVEIGHGVGAAEFQLLLQEIKGEILSSERYDLVFKTKLQELFDGQSLEALADDCAKLWKDEKQLSFSDKNRWVHWFLWLFQTPSTKARNKAAFEAIVRQKIFMKIYQEFKGIYE
jgi:hypothetical protein